MNENKTFAGKKRHLFELKAEWTTFNSRKHVFPEKDCDAFLETNLTGAYRTGFTLHPFV